MQARGLGHRSTEPAQNPVRVVYIPGACWPSSPVEMMSSWKDFICKDRQRTIEEDTHLQTQEIHRQYSVFHKEQISLAVYQSNGNASKWTKEVALQSTGTIQPSFLD